MANETRGKAFGRSMSLPKEGRDGGEGEVASNVQSASPRVHVTTPRAAMSPKIARKVAYFEEVGAAFVPDRLVRQNSTGGGSTPEVLRRLSLEGSGSCLKQLPPSSPASAASMKSEISQASSEMATGPVPRFEDASMSLERDKAEPRWQKPELTVSVDPWCEVSPVGPLSLQTPASPSSSEEYGSPKGGGSPLTPSLAGPAVSAWDMQPAGPETEPAESVEEVLVHPAPPMLQQPSLHTPVSSEPPTPKIKSSIATEMVPDRPSVPREAHPDLYRTVPPPSSRGGSIATSIAPSVRSRGTSASSTSLEISSRSAFSEEHDILWSAHKRAISAEGGGHADRRDPRSLMPEGWDKAVLVPTEGFVGRSSSHNVLKGMGGGAGVGLGLGLGSGVVQHLMLPEGGGGGRRPGAVVENKERKREGGHRRGAMSDPERGGRPTLRGIFRNDESGRGSMWADGGLDESGGASQLWLPNESLSPLPKLQPGRHGRGGSASGLDSEQASTRDPGSPVSVWSEVHEDAAAISPSHDTAPAWSSISNVGLVMRPLPPDVGTVFCYVVRDRGRYHTTYTLYTQEGAARRDRMLLVAREERNMGRVEFSIATQLAGTRTHSLEDGYLGSVSANFMGTRFDISQQTAMELEKGQTSRPRRKLLGIARYRPTVMTWRGDWRRMRVVIPKPPVSVFNQESAYGMLPRWEAEDDDSFPSTPLSAASTFAPWGAPAGNGESWFPAPSGPVARSFSWMDSSVDSGTRPHRRHSATMTRLAKGPSTVAEHTPGSAGGSAARTHIERGGERERHTERPTITLKSREPTEQIVNGVKRYVLPFNGRCKMPSVKNFQLTFEGNAEMVVLLFAKDGKDTYAMDYSWPLSAYQAFAISLTSMAWKLCYIL